MPEDKMDVSRVKLSLLMEQNKTSFTKTELKLFEHIKEHLETVMYSSLTELAEICGVGEATILRFCRKIGLKGYQDFKLAVAQELSIAHQIVSREADTFADRIKANMKQVIDDTYAAIDENALKASIDLIKMSSDIIIYGVGHSGITALDLQSRLMRIGKMTQVVTDSHFQAIRSCAAHANTVIIAISLTGSTKDIVDAVQMAKQNQAKVIAITNYVRSPLTKLADVILLTSGKENPLDGGSLVAKISQLYVIDLLCTGYALEIYDAANKFRNDTAEAVTSKLY